MIILPAIDMLGGKAVRLHQGNYDKAKSYSDNPLEVAKEFAHLGAKRIHVVDLDAARSQGNNRSVLKSIAQETGLQIQTGGGIRSERDVEELLAAGVRKLILGTILVKDPDSVHKWITKFEAEFIAGIDARDGMVKISGWEQESGIIDLDLAKQTAQMGCSGIVYTNISRDGNLSGPDLERTVMIAEKSSLPVIVSGGIANAQDIHNSAEEEKKGIVGVITGTAYYEGKIDLKQLFKKYPSRAVKEW